MKILPKHKLKYMKPRLSFFNRAKLHQQKFRVHNLKIDDYDIYPTMLKDEHASQGHNFYLGFPGILDAICLRYKPGGPLYKNLLRSEHIPYNLFGPLHLNISNSMVSKFFQILFPHLNIIVVDKIEFEKSPAKSNIGRISTGVYLDDNTSFDVMVSYTAESGRGVLGVEVKYTEKSYQYGYTEKQRMFTETEDSLYHQCHNNAHVYKPGTISLLRKKELKQFWRNHLLGLKMIQNGDTNVFTSVHLYPAGNIYQEEKARAYQKTLTDTTQNTFVPLTYEDFISKGEEVFGAEDCWSDWLTYLKDRYIFE